MAQTKKTRSREKRGYALKFERGERPFIYSTERNNWADAVKRNDDRAIKEWGSAWAKKRQAAGDRAFT